MNASGIAETIISRRRPTSPSSSNRTSSTDFSKSWTSRRKSPISSRLQKKGLEDILQKKVTELDASELKQLAQVINAWTTKKKRHQKGQNKSIKPGRPKGSTDSKKRSRRTNQQIQNQNNELEDDTQENDYTPIPLQQE